GRAGGFVVAGEIGFRGGRGRLCRLEGRLFGWDDGRGDLATELPGELDGDVLKRLCVMQELLESRAVATREALRVLGARVTRQACEATRERAADAPLGGLPSASPLAAPPPPPAAPPSAGP